MSGVPDREEQQQIDEDDYETGVLAPLDFAPAWPAGTGRGRPTSGSVRRDKEGTGPMGSSGKIDVRLEPDHEAPTLNGQRPMLTWGEHPQYGYGWRLWYLDDPHSPTAGVEEHFIPGDLLDVDLAVERAEQLLGLNLQ